MGKTLIRCLTALCLILSLVLAIPVTTSAKTLSVTKEDDLMSIPILSSGSNKIKLNNAKSGEYQTFGYTADKDGTYIFKLSNVKVSSVKNGGVYFFTYVGWDASDMFYKYSSKECNINGKKTDKCTAVTDSYWKSLPKSGESNVYREATQKNLEQLSQFHNPTIKVKLKKGETLMFRIYYIINFSGKNGAVGEHVDKKVTLKVKVTRKG